MADVAMLYKPILGSIAKTGSDPNAALGSFVDSVTFDAMVSEQHSGEVQVTDNPVERGIDVSDNIRPKPEQLQLDVLVSNSPLARALLGSPNSPKRATEAFRVLRELRDAGTLVTVVTSLRTYESMVIQKIDVTRNNKTGQALSAKIALRQIIQADTKTVAAPKKPSGNGKKKEGKKPPKEATAEQKKTLLRKAVDYGFSLATAP